MSSLASQPGLLERFKARLVRNLGCREHLREHTRICTCICAYVHTHTHTKKEKKKEKKKKKKEKMSEFHSSCWEGKIKCVRVVFCPWVCNMYSSRQHPGSGKRNSVHKEGPACYWKALSSLCEPSRLLSKLPPPWDPQLSGC